MLHPRTHTRRPPAAVLWDMDGTIVDTEGHWITAAERMLAKDDVVAPRSALDELIGLALPDGARVIQELGASGSPESIVARWLDLALECTRAEGIDWRPGARSLLSEIKAARVPLALVTMSYRRYAEEILTTLPSGTFDRIVTGDDVSRGKPFPDAYLRAAELLGVDPLDCIAIEDSPVGLASARAAGVATVGVPHHLPLADDSADVLWPTLSGRGLQDLHLPLRPATARY
ncbi:HAD family hydrolase [Microbacterium sp. A84]|uniref:HAD family hydrolase n=1 Tax=Microbacterium sp. A84 TaxID=3450715 RepID=UPI003F4307A5